MAMSEADRTDAMRRIVRELFVATGATATFTTTEIKAAVDAIDDAFDSTISEHTGTDSIEVAINKMLPVPFKTTATTEQKALLFIYATMKRYGRY